jgi:hypothetical protein
MARFLMVWELGAGIGHLANLSPIAAELQSRGHFVTAAVREFSHVHRFFAGVPVVAAPTVLHPPRQPIARASTFADILYNSGSADPLELSNLVEAWRSLFAMVRPDVIVMEHSPLALLASQGIDCGRVIVGTGFYSPPDVSPLPDLCPWNDNYPDRLLRTEQLVCARFNDYLMKIGQPVVPRLAALFLRVDANILATFRELDHYDCRTEGDYAGTWGHVQAPPPHWPAGEGPRIFVYLRPYLYARPLIEVLHRLKRPALIYYAEADQTVIQHNSAPHLRIVDHPVDMESVAAACDLAILYGSHDTTAAMLLAGTPMLQLPQHVEQYLVAKRVEELAAGISLRSAEQVAIESALNELLSNGSYLHSARAFADQYSGHDPRAVLQGVADRIEALASR